MKSFDLFLETFVVSILFIGGYGLAYGIHLRKQNIIIVSILFIGGYGLACETADYFLKVGNRFNPIYWWIRFSIITVMGQLLSILWFQSYLLVDTV